MIIIIISCISTSRVSFTLRLLLTYNNPTSWINGEMHVREVQDRSSSGDQLNWWKCSWLSVPVGFLFSWRYNPLWLYFHSPVAGFSFFVFEVSWSYTTTYHSREDSPGRVIGPSQRPLPDNTHHSQQTSMPRWDSNPQSQQASGRRPTP